MNASDDRFGPPAGPALLELSGISKSFGGVQALRDVDFTLRAGEIHGLVGENGAGKSTLMKIIAGVHTDFTGTMRIDGEAVRFRSARDALDAGVGMVHQELSIVPDLSVAENVFLGVQPTQGGIIAWKRMVREAREHLAGLGIDVDPRERMGSLSIGLQQLIEIARVIFSGARIIILDEPTSALSPPEVERLFEVLARLKADGSSFIFISHFLDDILKISDEITIFRNGRQDRHQPDQGHRQALGHRAHDRRRPRGARRDLYGRVHAAAEGGRKGGAEGQRNFLRAQPQERVARGARRRDPWHLRLHGLRRARADARALRQDQAGGRACARRRHAAAVRTRRRRGAPASLSCRRAAAPCSSTTSRSSRTPRSRILERISRLWLKPRNERDIAQRHVESLNIKTAGVDALLGQLSGGNQQKVALAKWLTHAPKVLILSEPTRGMDVGAKEDVVKIVRGLRDAGMAIIVASTEPETILSLADRILVMKKGEIVKEFAEGTVSKDRLLEAA